MTFRCLLMNCSKKHGKFFDPTTSGKNICLQKNGVIIIFILNMKIRKDQQYGKRLSDNQAILKAGHYCLTTTYQDYIFPCIEEWHQKLMYPASLLTEITHDSLEMNKLYCCIVDISYLMFCSQMYPIVDISHNVLVADVSYPKEEALFSPTVITHFSPCLTLICHEQRQNPKGAGQHPRLSFEEAKFKMIP